MQVECDHFSNRKSNNVSVSSELELVLETRMKTAIDSVFLIATVGRADDQVPFFSTS